MKSIRNLLIAITVGILFTISFAVQAKSITQKVNPHEYIFWGFPPSQFDVQ